MIFILLITFVMIQEKVIRRISPKSPSVAEEQSFSANRGGFGVSRWKFCPKSFCFLMATFPVKCHAESIFLNSRTVLDNKKDRSTMT
jgi:hypothetical protein